ncbi:hypothetical protein Fcan01_20258 [Folsomia candida]|uniref:Uncharacterized protein n=1 Tax=Folsomia candida TaxID=158441 RepID=A0A226DJI3_FOLCA|nr:hypothetical protein Fcan01_20258 [Folsomia candida]
MDLDPGKKWKYTTCSKTYQTKKYLNRHVTIHDSYAMVKCDICGKSVKHAGYLSGHMKRIHTSRKRPSCNICNREFFCSSTLRKHIEDIHSTSERPRFPCGFLGCKKTFLQKREVSRHIKTVHAENPVRFPCTLCGKEFNTRAHLESHTPTHTTERPFKCTKCGRGFSRRTDMRNHDLTHLERCARQMFKCPVCLQTYLTARGLQLHIRFLHENERNYPCELCGKRFSRSAHLRRHVEAKHPGTKEKVHSCDKCEYRTHVMVNLRDHRKRHFAGKHACYFCGKRFVTFRELVNYCGRNHTMEISLGEFDVWLTKIGQQMPKKSTSEVDHLLPHFSEGKLSRGKIVEKPISKLAGLASPIKLQPPKKFSRTVFRKIDALTRVPQHILEGFKKTRFFESPSLPYLVEQPVRVRKLTNLTQLRSNAQLKRNGPKLFVNIVLPKSAKRGPVFRIKPMHLYFMRMGKVLSVLTHNFTYADRLDLDFNAFADDINISDHYVPIVDKIRLRFFVDVQKAYEVADVDRKTHCDSMRSAEAKHPLTNLKTSLGKFVNSAKLSDVVICCEDREFSANRLILSVTSPVFEKMFASKTQENVGRRVVVKDVDKGVMELMLGYMYCGEVTVLPDLESLIGLYKAAHKYCMDPLRIWCAYQLVENYLKCDHVLELWSLAKTYEETGLMEETKRFMKAGKRQIFQDLELYLEFNKIYPELLHELFLL